MGELQLLVSLHLSDNEITSDRELYYSILDEFNINEKDLMDIDRSMVNRVKVNKENITKMYDKIDIDYNKYINEVLKFSAHMDKEVDIGCRPEVRKLYKDHLVMGKEHKIMESYKMIN